MAKPAKTEPKPAPKSVTVPLEDWVLVRMPPEEGKPADRYAVVHVEGLTELTAGTVLERDLSLATGRKQVAIALKRAHEVKLRSLSAVTP